MSKELRNHMRNIAASAALAVVFAFVFLFAWRSLPDVLFARDPGFLLQGTAAFTGAFFAFLFIRVGDFLTRVYERELRHYNALTTLEREFNEHFAIISDNLFVLPDFRENISQGRIAPMGIRSLTIDRSVYNDLHNLQLLNKIFNFHDGVRKFNNDIDLLGSLYTGLRDRFMQGTIQLTDEKRLELNQRNYEINAQYIAEQLKLLEDYLRGLERETLEILAMARLRLRRDTPLGTKLQRLCLVGLHAEIKDSDVESEIKKIQTEHRRLQAPPSGVKSIG